MLTTVDRLKENAYSEIRQKGEVLHYERRAGEEEMTEIRVVSGETNLIIHIETYQFQ